ncbi:MAG: AAA family ATPase [Syntrophales bacterium]
MHLTGVTLHPAKYPTRGFYPFNLPLFQQTDRIAFPSPVTLFVGENGSGKSTLLRAIARACGIHIWQEAERRRFAPNPYEEALGDFLSVEWVDGRVPGSFFGSDSFRHFRQVLDEWAAADPGQLDYFGGRSLMTQSHGESLMSFFRSRYRIKGLYLLDEPETALSPKSQLGLLEVMQEAGQGGQAQFVIATHSPLLMAAPQAVIYNFDRIPLGQIAYRETEHYRIYRDFLQHPPK